MRSKNAAKNIVSTLLLQIVTIACGFIIPKLIIETFGSATNGLINSITQFLAYITLLESGFGPVVKSILYKPIAEKNKEQITKILKSTEKFFRHVALIFVAYIIVLCFCYPNIIDHQFGGWFTVSLLLVIAVGTFVEYFFGMTYGLYLQAEQKTYISSYFQLVTTILTTVVTIVLIKCGFGIQIVKLGVAVVAILRPLLQNYYVKKKYNLNLSKVKSGYIIKQKWDGLAQHIAAVIHGNTDVVVLSVLSTMKEVSVYSVYMLVIKGVKNIVQALNNGIDASFGDMLAKKEYDVLQKRFLTYEFFFHTVSSTIFITTMLLITPFINVYMAGVTDTEYVRPVFGVLIVIAEFLWAVRLPYSSITLAAGHFKETRKGAWVEAILNIVISVILVFKLGIIGVAIGTAVAMFVRTVEFMIHSSKYILRRSSFIALKWLGLIIFESALVWLITQVFNLSLPNSYGEWILQAILILVVSGAVVVSLNSLCHVSELKDFGKTMKKLIKKG